MKKMQDAGEPRQLNGRDRSAARGLFPRLEGVDDLPGKRHARDPDELDPLDVTDHGDPHRWDPHT